MYTKEEFFNKYLKDSSPKFAYMLLDRMRSDCAYFLEYETNCPREYNHLWADHDPKAQITYMKYIWDYLPEKPEWLTMEEIEAYERSMVG